MPLTLDVQTLFVVMMVNMISVSLAVPAIVGWRVHSATRCMQGSLIAQTLGWSALVLSNSVHEQPLATLGIACLALGQAVLWEAMRGWLGPRPGRVLMWALVPLTTLGYGLAFGSYALRVGWSNAGLALQMLGILVAVAWPAPHASRRWRALIGLCMAALAAATLWRGVLGAFYTAQYPTMLTPHPVNLAAALIGNLALVLSTVALLVAWREDAQRALEQLARTDPLTGLLNRRALQHNACSLLAQARQSGQALTVLMIDIDHFKRINDHSGHAAGDQALRLVAEVLQGQSRPGDLACRWGGEEFCLILPGCDAEAAHALDRRLRTALDHRSRSSLDHPMDFSAGLATLQPEDADLEAMLQRADGALYQAKTSGRGRLVWASPATPAPPPAHAHAPRPTVMPDVAPVA